MGLRLITGGMKSTSIHAMEKLTKIQPLDERKVEKVLVSRQKYLRLKTHPLHKKKFKNPSETDLKD
jgi:hypothetical protein